MLEFTCPGCLSRCVANGAFRGMRARCVVCGAFIRIPAQTGEVAFPLGPLPKGALPSTAAKAPAAKPPKPSLRPRSGSGLIVLSEEDEAARLEPHGIDDSPLETNADTDTDSPEGEDVLLKVDEPLVEEPKPEREREPKAKKGSPKKKTAKSAEKVAGEELDGKLTWEDFEGEGAEAEAAAPKPPVPWWRTPRYMAIVGGSVLASIVIALVLGLSGEKVEPPVVARPPEPEPPPPPPPPKPPEKKKLPEPPQKAPYPRVSGTPNHIIDWDFMARRADNPTAWDDHYRGKLFIIHGTYSRLMRQSFFLADSPTNYFGITCEPPKDTKEPNPKKLAQLVKDEIRANQLREKVRQTGPASLTDEERRLYEAVQALLPDPPVEAATLKPGQPITIRGWYEGGLKFSFCRIVSTTGPDDAVILGKEIEVVGIVGSANAADPTSDKANPLPSVVLEAPNTDCPITLRCMFRPTDREKVLALKPGQTVTIRGRNSGRSFRTVHLDNCVQLDNGAPLTLGVRRVEAASFFALYEDDLMPYLRPSPTVPPIAVTAEELAAAFTADYKEASNSYGYKAVLVKGNVLPDEKPKETGITPIGAKPPGTTNSPTSGTVILETGTSDRYRLLVVMTATNYAAFKEKKSRELSFRGICTGRDGRYIRIDNAQLDDPDRDDPSKRITADYLPLKRATSLEYDVLTIKGRTNNPIMRIRVSVEDPDLVRVTPLRGGTVAKDTLFSNPPPRPKWTKNLERVKGDVQTSQFRLNGDRIEVRDRPPPPALAGTWWDPKLKIGARKNETWTSTMPDGTVVTYTVLGFSIDEAKRHTVEVRRVKKDPKDMEAWEESLITYKTGIGEYSRIISMVHVKGQAITTVEMKLVESDPDAEPEPKNPSTPPRKNSP